jgi:prepilin-type N-terminal cleavage/methylation domain-containing protein
MPQSPKKNSRPDAGFTLIELLLVTLLVPVVAFSIFANFRSGIELWSAVTAGVPGEDYARFYRKLAEDTQNACRYSTQPFSGVPVEFEFCSVPREGSEPRRIRYFYDESEKTIVREERSLSDVHKERPGTLSGALGGVQSFSVSYYIFDPLNESYQWRDAWAGKPEEFPAAIRLTFETDRDGVRESSTRTVRFYLGA